MKAAAANASTFGCDFYSVTPAVIAESRGSCFAAMIALLLQKTTERERELGLAYIAAMQARVAEIAADPALKADFEARIGQPAPR